MLSSSVALRLAGAAFLIAAASPLVAANETSGSETKTPAATPAPKGKSAKPEERKICKTFEPTGSRLGAKKVCLTARQWRASGS